MELGKLPRILKWGALMNLFAKSVLAVTSFLVLFSWDMAEAKQKQNQKQNQGARSQQQQSIGVDEAASDADILRAIRDQRRVNFLEGGSMTVTKVLPDDNNGLKHQKWVVRLTNGTTLQAVYNSDMCPRVPIKVGDVIAMGGMFIWTNSGPMLHWLHHDPRGNRPDGYVYVKGNFYCRD